MNELHPKESYYLEVARVPEFPSTVSACEAALIVVDEHVVVEAVLPCESGVTYQTNKWLDS